MRVLLVALQSPEASLAGDGPSSPAGPPSGELPGEARAEQEQALALARGMRDAGRWAPLIVCRRGSWLAGRAGELGLPCVTLGQGAAARTAGCLRLWWRFRRQGHLLIQTLGTESVSWGARLAAWRRPFGARATLLVHAFPVRPPSAASLRSRHGRDVMAAQKILCGSEHVRERLHDAHCNGDSSSAGLPGERLERFLPCVDVDRLRVTPTPRREGTNFVFAMTESFLPQSGALPVLQAMLLLKQRSDLPPWEVRLYGNGPRCGEIWEEARALGVESRLCLLGPQPLAEALRRCDVWLAPGQADAEVPSTFWAGFVAGVPVIYSLSHLHREFLGHARPCLPLSAVSPEKIAEAMRLTLLDAPARVRLAEQAGQAAAAVDGATLAEHLRETYTQWAGAWGWLDAADHEALAAAQEASPAAPADSSPVREDAPPAPHRDAAPDLPPPAPEAAGGAPVAPPQPDEREPASGDASGTPPPAAASAPVRARTAKTRTKKRPRETP
ncbi:glycosyltransferase [uncultured Desulfovibrio sp.]|uniref:glycosyltransferase n=1 Tax=uncultured Desulfovibrio sp. TaxID=167968 RepID=UPI0032080624